MSDEFTKPTIRQIGLRVNYKCSNPSCGAFTTGPHTDTTKSINEGVAAHITAKSLGGARYDATLTSAQRKHPDNGMWLCQNHAKEVDNDEDRFPVELLKEWKRSAELKAREEIGKPQPQDDLHLIKSQALIAQGS